MLQRIDAGTESIIAQYVRDMGLLVHEEAKVARFQVLIGELFSGSFAITRLSAGVEKAIRIQRLHGETTGFIDSYYGNAVIEFEKSLAATGQQAERQMREYCAGFLAQEGHPFRELLGIASDGLTWKLYRPKLSPVFEGKLAPLTM